MGHKDPVRVQLTSLSSWVVTKPWLRTPSILIVPLRAEAWPTGRSLPVERAPGPFVDEPDDQDREEDHHRDEPEEADRVERHGPREKEGDLEVEQHEENRDQVVPDVEHQEDVFEGLEAALEVGKLFRMMPAGAEDLADEQ